jgi:hypothetical protein
MPCGCVPGRGRSLLKGESLKELFEFTLQFPAVSRTKVANHQKATPKKLPWQGGYKILFSLKFPLEIF